MDRRNFIYSLSGLMAMFATGCRRPEQNVFPAVNPVQSQAFGDYEYFDTAYFRKNEVFRLIIKTYDCKPIFISPNPTNGVFPPAAGIYAELYNLYNPKRFYKPKISGKDADIHNCIKEITQLIENTIISERNVVFAVDFRRSPSFAAIIAEATKSMHNVIFYDFNELVPVFNTFETNLRDMESLEIGCFIDCQNLIVSGLSKHHKYLKNKLNKDNCISLSYYESSDKVRVSLPKASFLECWEDYLSLNGDYFIAQPVIKKLNEGSLSDIELIYNIFKELGLETLQNNNSVYDIIKSRFTATEFEHIVLNGLENQEDTLLPNYSVEMFTDVPAKPTKNYKNHILYSNSNILITSYDEYMNPFLREINNPHSSIAYYNILEINALTAKKLKLGNGDIVKLSDGTNDCKLPVAVNNSLPEGVVVTDLNYGFERSKYSGGNINNIIYSRLNRSVEVKLRKTGENRKIHYQSGKISNDSIKSLKSIKEIDNFTVNNNIKYLSKHFGLLIDLNKCNGCSACVIACRNENNIPLVGAARIEKSRDMDWISIMSFDDQNETSEGYKNRFLPFMCQHCENAPCEIACPVNAATHSPEGVSETVYNRCIGTRYCMAACQYKVRKFNFANYFEDYPKELSAILNPKITVRSRGVVEKCSLCVQRINEFNAKNEDDKCGKLPVTACMEVCPKHAITLIDINSPEFKNYKTKNIDKLYQIVFGSANRPSVYYKLG